jgi:murein DD-endopeptidase MepM/ murein hydrolase activator NlpD
MENSSNKQQKGNKTFFVAVVTSLTMVIVACAVVYPQIIPPETENQLAEVSEVSTEETATVPDTQTETTTQDYTPVDNVVTNVKKTTTDFQTETTQQVTEVQQVETIVTSSGGAIMPIANGELLADFSEGELVKSSTSGIWQTHNGVDISAEVNTPVQAVADGTVTKVYEDALLGYCVTIDHTDYVANYCNLDAGVIVLEGDTVEKGSIIGTVGDTSVSESALDSHLHFETLVGGKYTNPTGLINN